MFQFFIFIKAQKAFKNPRQIFGIFPDCAFNGFIDQTPPLSQLIFESTFLFNAAAYDKHPPVRLDSALQKRCSSCGVANTRLQGRGSREAHGLGTAVMT